jgi:hypothetical protein
MTGCFHKILILIHKLYWKNYVVYLNAWENRNWNSCWFFHFQICHKARLIKIKYEEILTLCIAIGRQTATPQYIKYTYTRRSTKNGRLNADSLRFYRGLHEPWEWIDKCYKRFRNKGEFYRFDNKQPKIDHCRVRSEWPTFWVHKYNSHGFEISIEYSDRKHV